jgi:hypothetical protein
MIVIPSRVSSVRGRSRGSTSVRRVRPHRDNSQDRRRSGPEHLSRCHMRTSCIRATLPQLREWALSQELLPSVGCVASALNGAEASGRRTRHAFARSRSCLRVAAATMTSFVALLVVFDLVLNGRLGDQHTRLSTTVRGLPLPTSGPSRIGADFRRRDERVTAIASSAYDLGSPIRMVSDQASTSPRLISAIFSGANRGCRRSPAVHFQGSLHDPGNRRWRSAGPSGARVVWCWCRRPGCPAFLAGVVVCKR